MTGPNPSIPLREAALCCDCLCVFSMTAGVCPKCGGSIGWTAVESNRPAAEIRQLRERLSWLGAVLHQIAYGSHTKEFKSRAAIKALAYLRNETTPAATEVIERKEAVVSR